MPAWAQYISLQNYCLRDAAFQDGAACWQDSARTTGAQGQPQPRGALAQSRAEGAANHPQTREGEKLLVLNRLSHFSQPAGEGW